MCTEKDCMIFRGMIVACDACERNIKMSSQPTMAKENPAVVAS